MNKDKPDFICAGFHKCGTSWLHNNLRKHPEIKLPPIKEIDYLLEGRIVSNYTLYRAITAKDNVHQYKLRRLYPIFKSLRHSSNRTSKIKFLLKFFLTKHDNTWYTSLFANHHISGDISPTYSFLKEEHVREIASDFPEAKIIFCLREPISRAWSHNKMDLSRHRNLNEYSTEELTNNLKIIVETHPNYSETLSVWRKYFKHVHVIYLEEITLNPQKVLEEVYEYLGCENVKFQNRLVGEKRNVGENLNMPIELKRMMIQHLKPILREFATSEGSAWPQRWLAEYDKFENPNLS